MKPRDRGGVPGGANVLEYQRLSLPTGSGFAQKSIRFAQLGSWQVANVFTLRTCVTWLPLKLEAVCGGRGVSGIWTAICTETTPGLWFPMKAPPRCRH